MHRGRARLINPEPAGSAGIITRRRPMTVRAMFYVKEINHRHTGSAEVNVEVKMGAAFGSYLKGLPEGNGDWSK